LSTARVDRMVITHSVLKPEPEVTQLRLRRTCVSSSVFFSKRVVDRWNCHEQHIIDSTTINAFKTRLSKSRSETIVLSRRPNLLRTRCGRTCYLSLRAAGLMNFNPQHQLMFYNDGVVQTVRLSHLYWRVLFSRRIVKTPGYTLYNFWLMLVKIVRVIIKEKFDVNLHASGEKTQTLTKAVPLNRPGDFPTPSIWWSNINTKHFGAFAADCSSGQNWAKIGLSQTDEHACFQLGGNLNTAFKSGMLRQFCLDRPCVCHYSREQLQIISNEVWTDSSCFWANIRHQWRHSLLTRPGQSPSSGPGARDVRGPEVRVFVNIFYVGTLHT